MFEVKRAVFALVANLLSNNNRYESNNGINNNNDTDSDSDTNNSNTTNKLKAVLLTIYMSFLLIIFDLIYVF